MEISSTKQYSVICLNELVDIYGKFEDVKGAIRSRKSKERQYNTKKTKGQAMIYKILHKKLNIEQHESHPLKFILYLSYIFIQKNPIFLYNFCQKWLRIDF